MDLLTLLTAASILGAYLVGATGPRLRFGPIGRKPRRTASAVRPQGRSPGPNPVDATEQLRLVMGGEFQKKRIMSPDEARVFLQVERVVKSLGLPWRVMAQVSLGEVIRSVDKQAHAAINSKRVDILIISKSGEPIAAVEFQGSGHHLGTAAARDAVKKEALRKAGVAFVEVLPSHGADYIAGEIARLGALPARAA